MTKWIKRGCTLFCTLFLVACNSFTTRGLHYVSPDFSTSSRYSETALEVSSLTPTFQWESIADYLKRKGRTDEDIARITNVLYDIKIFPIQQWQPGDVNQIKGEYEKFNLSSTTHTLTEPLLPGASYVVMVRGFYQMGKQQHLVPWSKLRGSYSEWEHFMNFKAFMITGAPSGIGSYPYFFKTPAPGD